MPTTTTTAAAAAATTIAPSSSSLDVTTPLPTNGLVTPLLTDLYQITMVYAHWKNNRHNDIAIFELFFRKNPFGGEYTIFAGLDEVLKFLAHYKFTIDDIEYLQNNVPTLKHCDTEFFNWLLELDTKDVTVRALQDGTVAFPRVPLLIIEAPLGIAQLIETTLLTLVNYPSLIATNAARMVIAANSRFKSEGNDHDDDDDDDHNVHSIDTRTMNDNNNGSSNTNMTTDGSTIINTDGVIIRRRKSIRSSAINLPIDTDNIPAQCTAQPICIEFGLRRAQGPDGGFSASKYSSVGGFVATSNVQAGKLLGLKISGTHAHAFVQSYSTLDEVATNKLRRQSTITTTTTTTTTTTAGTGNDNDGVSNDNEVDLLPIVLKYRKQLSEQYDAAYGKTIDGELAAFIAYATAFPNSFLCLIDTYDTLRSGLLNFIIVSLALYDLGYIPVGVRLDSGDLAYLSMECATTFHTFLQDNSNYSFFADLSIVASNDINEEVLHALSKQEHAITAFGIGTNLVTCQAQPALGCVYKLVQLAGRPRIKLSQEISKVLIPSKKDAFRLIGKDNRPILDLLVADNEQAPQPGQRIMCRHPFVARKRAYVTPTHVQPLYTTVFTNGRPVPNANRTLNDARKNVQRELSILRPDVLRYTNPTPYKVSVSETLFDMLHDMWQHETPVAELS